MRYAALVGILLLTLSGCASSDTTGDTTAAAAAKEYGAVQELADDFIAAGGECNFSHDDQVKLAAQSGTCNDSTVLSIYLSEADRDEVVDNAKAFAEVVGMHLLVGPNWIINTPDPAPYKEALGGVVVTAKPKS